jgi:hypothetical protein
MKSNATGSGVGWSAWLGLCVQSGQPEESHGHPTGGGSEATAEHS